MHSLKSNYKILVIDDDPNNLDIIIKYFNDRPFSIMYAPNGQLGYEVGVKSLPDLIIMDWAMPQMNGIDATLMFKATESTKHIPIVMATGVMTGSVDLQRALEAGAIDYIRKPFDPLELTSRVNAALTLSASFYEIQRQKNEIQELLNKEKVLLQEQLDFKERELSIQALNAQERIQLFSELQDELKALRKELGTASYKSLNRLERKVKDGLNSDKDSETFLFHFQHVHPQFFKKIENLGVELTGNDIKLCAYVKLGMRNKEIANLAGIEVTSVKRNINRLKKKLGLHPEDSLRQYIGELS